MRNTQLRRILRPQRRKVYILAYLPPPIHLNSLALELRQLQLNRTAGVGGGDLELELELVPDQVVHAGTGAGPGTALLVQRLDLEPVIVSLLVDLHVGDDCLQLLFQTLLPLLVLGAGVDAQQRDVVGGLLYRTLHPVDYYNGL